MQPFNKPSDEDQYPKYGIRAAWQRTGLKPGTMRAWERRYGVPSPLRRPNGHRLYAEYDLKLLRWLVAQTEAGMTIGRAVDFLNHLRSQGQDPIGRPAHSPGPPGDTRPVAGKPSQEERA
jgi:DNA-binding transcriptional MerR regulator